MINDIFENIINKKSYRLLQKYPDTDTAVMIELQSEFKLPEICGLSDLEDMVEDGTCKILEQSNHSGSAEHLTKKQMQQINEIWNTIEPIIRNDELSFDEKKRSENIKKIMLVQHCAHTSLLRWLHKYWAGGCTKMALVPNYKARGGAGKERTDSNGRIGRPCKYQPQTDEMQIGKTEKWQIKHIVNMTYNKNSKYKMTDAYTKFIRTYYWNEETQSVVSPCPSITQFRYHAKKIWNLRKRIGEKKFDRTYRAIPGNSACEADGPGEKYQIDATIADVYLVSRADRNAVIGRPVLYFVTDVFSRMIAGFYVSLEGPSWTDAMMALYYTNMDKVQLCRQFGIDIQEGDWPCIGLPQQLLTDNGELVSKASSQLVSELGVHMQNTSAWRPDLKGIVEQSFHLINGRTRMLLPGGVQLDYRDRGVPDYKLDATLNLCEFNQIIIHYILKHNSRVLTKHPQKSEDIITAGIPAIPLALWNWGIQNRSGCLAKRTPQEVAYSLLPNGTARVTERGIKYKSQYYTCDSFIREDMGSQARINGTWQIMIKHDPRATKTILLCCEDGQYEVCTRLESYCEDWFEEDFQYQNQLEKSKGNANQKHNLKNEVAFQTQIDSIIKKAQAEKEQTDNVVAFPEKNKVRSNRKKDLLLQQKQESFLADSQHGNADEKQVKASNKVSTNNKCSAKILEWQREDDE
jgi:hypothetical protein